MITVWYCAIFLVADLDEYYATSQTDATFASITENGTKDCVGVRSSFMDPTAHYDDSFDPKSGAPILRTSSITKRYREVYPSDNRSKYVCRMRLVDQPMIHTVSGMRNGARMERPLPDQVILLHFRSTGAKDPFVGVEESRATAWAAQLEPRVAEVWQHIFG